MSSDWGQAIVVDPRMLQRLRTALARAERTARRRRRLMCGLAAVVLGLAGAHALVAARLATRDREIASRDHALAARAAEIAAVRETLAPVHAALAALSDSHRNILAATLQAPSVGTKSWGRRFTVTKYIPRSPAYGRFNDGLTATMTKADPARRIVAVDPALIPYGSWVWIEELGWYRAEDCGSAIKGFRLDLLTETTKDAMQFGKQQRFVIVVPPDGLEKATS